MDKDKVFPFPQADDFEKIISILNIQDDADLRDKSKVSMLLGDIDFRQVQYYMSALMYLGLMNADKSFSSKGKYIKSLGYSKQIVELAKAIVSKDVFGSAYFTERSFGVKLDKDDIINIMKEHVFFSSEGMYVRRSQTVIKWLEWINNNFR